MDICLIQTSPLEGARNLAHAGHVIGDVSADLYVLPELFTTGFDRNMLHGLTAPETIPDGATINHVMTYLNGRTSAVVCGLLEQSGSVHYNIAAVIGNGWMDWYRQKNPASTRHGRSLKIQRGDYRKVMLPSQWSVGLMICNDYNSAEEFFEEYKRRGVNAVVLIADSREHVWIRQFPNCCQRYGLPAIVCNAAGPNGGDSCIINAAGQFVPLNTPQGQRDQLPDTPMAAIGIL